MVLGAWLSLRVIDFAVFAARQDGRGFLLSHALALELDAVGIVNEAVQNCIGNGWVRDEVITAKVAFSVGSNHSALATPAFRFVLRRLRNNLRNNRRNAAGMLPL